MKYKSELKKRIEKIQPKIVVKKITLCGDSFKVAIENRDLNLIQVEQELREELSMPGLLLINCGE